MNSIWNKNFKAFKERFPQLTKMLSEEIPQFSENSSPYSTENPPPFWEILTAKNGEPTAKENGLLLHSAYNPNREASSIIQNKELAEKSTTIFLGFGLGYQLIEWAKTFSTANKKLVVIEPDPQHLMAAMCFKDLSEVFKIQKLIIAVCCPQDQIIHLIEDATKINIGNTGVTDSYIFENKAFTNHEEKYFADVKAILQRNKRKNEINAATLKKFGKLWCKNSLTNINQLCNLEYISSLKKTELPFLILGAGPTLTEVLPYLKLIKDKMIIVCVETALHALLKINFQPDFIILTDPQYWAYRHIAALKAPQSILITELTAFPAVFRFNCKKILLCSSQFPIGQYFEKKLKVDIGDLGTGGSVICSAWNFAQYCGAKKIYTAGMDMGFPENQTHIKGSSSEQTIHTISTRIKGAEKFNTTSLYSEASQAAKNFCGEKIITDSRMKMFAWWLEARIAACPDVKTYSLSSKSLYIPGITPVKTDEILLLPDLIEQKKDFLESTESSKQKELTSKNLQNQKELLQKNLNSLIKEFPQKDFLEEYPYLKEYLK